MDRNEETPLSRRQIVGGVGSGLGIGAVAPASAQSRPQTASPQSQTDPTSKYPRPPYKKQSQPWPGLASQMEPKPDHGESSDRGSGSLGGGKALITGGGSGMGRGAAIAFAREGADVAINYPPDEEPDAREVIELIMAAGGNGVAIPGDIRDEAFCQRLEDEAAAALAASTSSSATPAGSRRTPPSSTSRPSNLTGR